MLRLLRIRNLALIRELEIEFGRGLNLLTGETGSGKSILVDALGLILGARASQELIRAESDAAVIEGAFEISADSPAIGLLTEAGFEIEDGALLIRREIAASGRSRVWVNNNLSTLALLKKLGEALADIHGQQEQQALLDLSTHLEWLDEFGGNQAPLEEARACFKALRETARRLDGIESNEQERLRRIDMLRFQIGEIGKVNPLPGEKEELEKERDLLTHHEHILALTTEAYALLYESESSVLGNLNNLEKLCREMSGFDRDWHGRIEAIRECRYKLEDVAYAARDYSSGYDFSPERLEAVHERLNVLDKLVRKYGASCEEVLRYREQCAAELATLLSAAESGDRLAEKFAEELKIYEQIAGRLSEKRREDAARFERAIREEFNSLAMERMELRAHFHDSQDRKKENLSSDDPKPETRKRLPTGYGLNGIDNVEFLIAPNRGEDMRPLAKIASGGELSRLMLAIKSLCENADKDRTLVFDEVDAGIGGRVAEAVGKRLESIAEKNQVLCVTHLPQVAAFALHHFNVRKESVGERTETFVKLLRDEERIEEIARMLGGENLTSATRRYAAEMLNSRTRQ